MTDTPATSRSALRYRLATFGTLALVGPGDSTVLGTHGHHRRRLALLAVLAAAGERGRSRDQLLLLFWPDATQSRARHALEQLLYSLRSSIGESVFATSNPVRLNAEVVQSDVAAFNAALERSDLDAAVEEYRGPFLDGFYLEDAPEFERWVESERARLATSYAEALDRLAHSADAALERTAAVRWWRKLAEADPLSGKTATGLIRALMNEGDHAAALQYAERYQAIVADELGASAGPAVANLVAEVRAKAAGNPVAVSHSPPVLPRPKPPAAPASLDATPNDEPRSARARGRLTPYTITAMALAALIAIAATLRLMVHDDRALAGAEPSIAVLPFVNVSRNPQDAALVDGLTEELIGVLAKLGGVRVTARTSAFLFKNTRADVRRIADSLGVSYILEGGVQRVDSQMRVEVRLLDARAGSTRWSETYDRNLRDIFAVQSDIAGEVARELDVRLGGNTLASIGPAPTRNIAAYELYLHGNDPALMRSDSSVSTALDYFRRAIALDSSYAAAYAGLARMQTRLARGDTTMSFREHMDLAERAARKAVALNGSLGEAHAALGIVSRANLDLASAETELKRAVALEPMTARFHLWLGQLYGMRGRPAEALAEARRAVTLDPLSPSATAELARGLFVSGRCNEALAQLTKLRGLQPPLLRSRSIAAQCYARMGMWPEAIAEARENTMSAGVLAQGLLGHVLARAGRTDEARQILSALLDQHARRADVGAFEVAAVYAGLGEKDHAFAWLDTAMAERAITFEHLPVVLDALSPDPRADDFRRRLGIQKR